MAGAITRFVSISLGVDQEKQLSVIGNPIRDDPEVYMAYLQFLKLEDGLLVTHEPPQPGAAHIWRCYGGTYYWIPIHRRAEFFELSVRLTGLRHAPSALASESFELRIDDVTDIAPIPPTQAPPVPGTRFRLTLKLATPLPRNDSGTANVKIGDIIYPVTFLLDDSVAVGSETDTLLLTYTYGTETQLRQIPVDPRTVAAALRDQEVDFFSARFRPPPPTSDRLLRDIREELNAIRLDQLRR